MRNDGVIVGAILVIIGIGLFAFYDHFVRYEREGRELLTEGKLIYERGSRDAINDSINIFSKVIARYPGTQAETEAYFYIAQSYEKLGLNRLAYLKYVYVIKNNKNVDQALGDEIRARIARLKMTKSHTEEGIHQLLSLLNYSYNSEFRSRVYTELGHTYLQMRDYEKSKRMFDFALTECGDNEEAILGKARAYKRLGQYDMAFNMYEYFFKYYGNFSPYVEDVKRAYLDQVNQAGRESFRKGNYSSAIGYFKRILHHFPDSNIADSCLYWIGQCYFSMHKYGSAINYYDRVLGYENSRKGEDARIKKGYAYFMLKKFDLAAREFQVYINNYPHGRHIDIARKWKSMSTQEMLYRIQNKMVPNADEEGETTEKGKKGEGNDKPQPVDKDKENADKAMTGRPDGSHDEDAEYENVGEL